MAAAGGTKARCDWVDRHRALADQGLTRLAQPEGFVERRFEVHVADERRRITE
ncbi:hypothetical protein chiPu_0033966, partial [Chiloscyllium punctatum]|nr:hypothetical protein [Chiloscyllium punctatum]